MKYQTTLSHFLQFAMHIAQLLVIAFASFDLLNLFDSG